MEESRCANNGGVFRFMKSVVFFFEAHQPMRIRPYRMADIGTKHDYFWESKNREIVQRVSEKCYIPATQALIDNGIKASLSISGILLDQLTAINSGSLDVFKEYFRSGLGEPVAETYYHSLSSIWNKREFFYQVNKHREAISMFFGKTPQTFRNTELIYNDDVSKLAKDLDFKNIITEGTDKIIAYNTPNVKYSSVSGLNLLLRNYKLSDDVSFRFSNHTWNEFPLYADKFSDWVARSPGDVVNLFMDYETFGEHQWKETGIFEFLKALPKELEKRGISIKTIDEFCNENRKGNVLSLPDYVSWADVGRNLNAWLGNDMQREAFDLLKSLENNTNPETWRRLQVSDLIYYMSVSRFSDQEVHDYFNPYGSPYYAFMNYMSVLEDFRRTYSSR